MENVTTIKLDNDRNKLFRSPIATSDPFYCTAMSDYDKQKDEENKKIRNEIHRTSLKEQLV